MCDPSFLTYRSQIGISEKAGTRQDRLIITLNFHAPDLDPKRGGNSKVPDSAPETRYGGIRSLRRPFHTPMSQLVLHYIFYVVDISDRRSHRHP